MIKIAEIFGPTVQGEGAEAGARTIFVRVQGCSFNCSWCDSKFTWGSSDKAEEYSPYNLAYHLIKMCSDTQCSHIVLTGGNPCLYEFTETIHLLHENDIVVDVETQGDLIPEWLHLVDTITFSPKPPSSGQKDTYPNISQYIENVKLYGKVHPYYYQNIIVKIPVFDQEDIEFSRKFAKLINTCQTYKTIGTLRITFKFYLSVGNSDVDTTESIRDRVLLDYEHLISVINELNYPEFRHCYILPQIHTLVWGNRQGV